MTVIFTPKPFAEIVADEVERVRLSTDRLTDFNVGSVARSLLEATAVELDDYYLEMYLGLLRGIPTAIYTGFGFDLRPAIAATGVAVFARGDAPLDLALEIPAGTYFVTMSGARFITDADAVIPAGETEASVTITAETEGIAGNSGPLTLLTTTSTTAYSVSNPAILAGGADSETEEQRAQRFASFIRSLARGTVAALEYGATIPAIYHPITGVLSERVQRAAVLETPGYVQLFVHNGSYGASDELVALVQELIDGKRDTEFDAWVGGYRPAGMRVVVEVMTDLGMDISLELQAGIGYVQADIEAELLAKIAAWLRSALPGQLVRPIDFISLALGTDGVTGATIIAPTTTHVVAASTVVFLASLDISWAA